MESRLLLRESSFLFRDIQYNSLLNNYSFLLSSHLVRTVSSCNVAKD